ncbi:MAG: glutamine--fructose-6-phosphate transaminase (isomerizing) [Deferribacterota bacterium]|nr:glutamine--fructose-6-phosphate transaminase (isomerizing) [Deferribacterota bacterium]
MCGIVAYIGKRNAIEVIIDCLKRLEYRGYDSAGLALLKDQEVTIIKKTGKIKELEKTCSEKLYINATLGIGHTRWATHGLVNEKNAHPHQSKNIILVHNGVVDNYLQLKEFFSNRIDFSSETDSELIAHLVEYNYKGDLCDATIKSLNKLRGSFALSIITPNEPDKIVLVKKDSPLIIGIGENEMFAASDLPALVPYTNKFIFLEDNCVASIKRDKVEIFDFNGNKIEPKYETISLNARCVEKYGYKHYMLKEIFEQPRALVDTFTGHISNSQDKIIFNELKGAEEMLLNAKYVEVIGCGTSYHSAMVAKYLIEKYVGIPVIADIASEYRYRENSFEKDSLLIAISQSGETADTLASVKLARERGQKVIVISNVFSSSIPRYSDITLYTYAGPEISVASTKAFITQLTIIYLFSIYFGALKKSIGEKDVKLLVKDFVRLPEQLNYILSFNKDIEEFAKNCSGYKHFFFLGRGINYPIALEGALKLKEVAYIHAEGYAAGELKHGPIALVSPEIPTFVIATKSNVYDKILTNIEEIRARKGKVYIIKSKNDKFLDGFRGDSISIIDTSEELSIFQNTVIFQLFAYHCANFLGLDVDQPRNLAKSVTVE